MCVYAVSHFFFVFRTVAGYKSDMQPIDFGVNGYIFKVKGHLNIAFDISGHSSSLWIDIEIVLF